jgi:threonyl-tRNA synthetase
MATDSHHIEITLPGGSHRRVPAGSRVADVLRDEKNASDILAAKVNGTLADLSTALQDDALVEPVTFASPEGKEVYRHSSTHIMAQAVKDVFPSAQLTIGPALEDTFYYDFAFERPFTPEDLEKIETRAQEIIKADRPFSRREMSREEGMQFFRGQGEQYKVEIIEGFQDPTVSLYEQGSGFVEHRACRRDQIALDRGRILARR